MTVDKTWASVGLSFLICKMGWDEMMLRTLLAGEVLGFRLAIEC